MVLVLRPTNCLDMKIYVDSDGYIQTDLYAKPNTKCQYLLPHSAHPRHCFPGITKSLAHRVVRICSRQEDREKRLVELKELLMGRGYKSSMVHEVMDMARNMDRDQALERVNRVGEVKKVRYVMTFDPRLPPLLWWRGTRGLGQHFLGHLSVVTEGDRTLLATL